MKLRANAGWPTYCSPASFCSCWALRCGWATRWLRPVAWMIASRPVDATACRSRCRRPRCAERTPPASRVIARLDRAIQYPRSVVIARSSRAMTALGKANLIEKCLIVPGKPSLAGIKPAIVDALKADVVTVCAVHAGDARRAVPAGAMCGRDIAVDQVDVRRPLNDAAGVVSSEAGIGPGKARIGSEKAPAKCYVDQSVWQNVSAIAMHISSAGTDRFDDLSAAVVFPPYLVDPRWRAP